MFSYVAPERRGRRARAAPRVGEGDARQARARVPRHRRRRGRPRRVRRAQVRLRGVAAVAGQVPRGHLHVELHRVPGAAARHPRAGPRATRPSRRSTARSPTTRWIVAILEQHQQPDGSVVVPQAMRRLPAPGVTCSSPSRADARPSYALVAALAAACFSLWTSPRSSPWTSTGPSSTSDGSLSPAVRAAVRRVVASGAHVVIATGRSMHGTLPVRRAGTTQRYRGVLQRHGHRRRGGPGAGRGGERRRDRVGALLRSGC